MRQFVNKVNSKMVVFLDDTDESIKDYEMNDEWYELFEWDTVY